jgi:hypothetical protein
MTMINRIPCALALLLGATLAQAQHHTSSTQVPTPKPITDSEPSHHRGQDQPTCCNMRTEETGLGVRCKTRAPSSL